MALALIGKAPVAIKYRANLPSLPSRAGGERIWRVGLGDWRGKAPLAAGKGGAQRCTDDLTVVADHLRVMCLTISAQQMVIPLLWGERFASRVFSSDLLVS